MAKILLILLAIVVKTFSLSSLAEGDRLSCTFDSDLCGWHSVISTKFQWRKGSGQTDDRTSGPLNDHTCANYNGEYVFISGEDAESHKDVAVLESDVFSIDKETYLTFWYIMNGFGTGTLSVSAVSGNTTAELWRKVGRQERDWVKHTLTLSPGKMRLQFKATVRIPIGSDIAVDDILLSSESQNKDVNKTHCKVSTTTTSTTTTTTTLPTTTTAEKMNKTHKASSHTTVSSTNPLSSTCMKIVGKTEVLAGSCDFENGICGIKIIANDSNKLVTWERTNTMDGTRYRTDSIFGDHTLEDNNKTKGFYLVFRNAWSFVNNKLIAAVETPAIYASYACLTFWYNVPTNYSNLKVSLRDYTGRLIPIWSVDNNNPKTRVANTTGWHKESLSISQDPPFTIVFQANNNYHWAKVGLDDIKIVGMNITTVVPVPTQKTTLQYSINTTTSPISKTALEISTASTTVSTLLTTTVTGNLEIITTGSSSAQTEPDEKLSSSQQSNTPYLSSPVTSIHSLNTNSYSTETGGKKTTTPKKPTKINNGKTDTKEQTKQNKIEKTSTIIGSAVGAVLGLAVIVVVVYLIVHSKRKARQRSRQETESKYGGGHEHMNGGVSNAGYTSHTDLKISMSNKEAKMNGYTSNLNENQSAFTLSQVITFSEGPVKNGGEHLNGHAYPVADKEQFTRL